MIRIDGLHAQHFVKDISDYIRPGETWSRRKFIRNTCIYMETLLFEVIVKKYIGSCLLLLLIVFSLLMKFFLRHLDRYPRQHAIRDP